MSNERTEPKFKVGDLVVWNKQPAAPVNKIYWYADDNLPVKTGWRVQSRGVDAPQGQFTAAE